MDLDIDEASAAFRDEARDWLETHVRALAGTIGERHYARPQALARAVAYLQDALARLGYEVTAQPFAAGGQTFHNLEVVIPGGSRGSARTGALPRREG